MDNDGMNLIIAGTTQAGYIPQKRFLMQNTQLVKLAGLCKLYAIRFLLIRLLLA